MRIAIKSNGVTTALAGDESLSEREHTSVFAFVIEGNTTRRIIRRVRAANAIPVDDGNLLTLVSFQTSRGFATPQQAADFCRDHEADFPRSGDLVFDTGAGKRKLTNAVVSPPSRKLNGCRVDLTYQASGDEIKLNEAEILIPQDLGSGLLYRVVQDGGETWHEVGFLSPTNTLIGNAADGWTDPTGHLLFRFERSDDLQTWDHDLISAPGSPEAVGDGDYVYWARSKYPIDSDIKTGHIWQESTAARGDSRNNPFTSITLAGAVQDLPNYPYTMPTDAAQLQTDLRAAGWDGATVVASSDIAWRIDIPSVSLTERISPGKIYWPVYLVPDIFGNVVNPFDGVSFIGEWVNSNNVRTANDKQFFRLGVSPGPNYLYS